MDAKRIDVIMRDPFRLQAELKRRGTNFSDIARAVSNKERSITPQQVRAVVYASYRPAHTELILEAIRKVLSAAGREVQLARQ